MLSITATQMQVLAASIEPESELRAIQHVKNCIPDIFLAMPEEDLREVIRWGRKRSRRYGVAREVDFFRYLNLMFMFGFSFDDDPRYPWAARVLNRTSQRASAKMDLLMDHAFLFLSRSEIEAAS